MGRDPTSIICMCLGVQLTFMSQKMKETSWIPKRKSAFSSAMALQEKATISTISRGQLSFTVVMLSSMSLQEDMSVMRENTSFKLKVSQMTDQRKHKPRD